MTTEQWPWSVLVYAAGDAIGGVGGLAADIHAQLAQLNQVATNRYVAALAQVTAGGDDTQRLILDPAHRFGPVSVGRLNVGDPDNLVDFTAWARDTCGAARIMLVLSGHGLAWQDHAADVILGRAPSRAPPSARRHARSLFGSRATRRPATRAILFDADSRDYLSNAELGAALERIAAARGTRIDVLVLDACLMSSWELLGEIDGAVTSVVASIDELSAAGIDVASSVHALSEAGGVSDPATLASDIARRFTPRAAFDSCVAIDLSAPAWARAEVELRRFTASLLGWLTASPAEAEAVRQAIARASLSVTRYADGNLADVGAIARELGGLAGLPAEARAALTAAVTAARSCVVASNTGTDYAQAAGLSIFAPRSASAYRANAADYRRLRFAQDTGWGAVLERLYPTGVRSAGHDEEDTEFLVVIEGVPIDGALQARLEAAVRRAAITELARLPTLEGSAIKPYSSLPLARRSPQDNVAGLVIQPRGEEL